MSHYLIYHPKRNISLVNGIKVYCDSFIGNQDPFIWNRKFLHTYCHATQMKNEPGQINFWVSDEKMTNFQHLYCDCVFVVAEKHFWENRNLIDKTDKIVDNRQAFICHYQWANLGEHKLTRRRRYTLKADPERSFQAQTVNSTLIDIVPFLINNGITLQDLHAGIITKRGSRPMEIPDELGRALYGYLYNEAVTKLKGAELEKLYPLPVEANTSGSGCC